MLSHDLPENLVSFIQFTVPTYSAAELLIFLAQHSEMLWKCDEIVSAMHPTVITAPAVTEYLALFKTRGLVSEQPDARFKYDPASSDLEAATLALASAYEERPVTLIRTIYALADRRIQSFADSFKLKKDNP